MDPNTATPPATPEPPIHTTLVPLEKVEEALKLLNFIGSSLAMLLQNCLAPVVGQLADASKDGAQVDDRLLVLSENVIRHLSRPLQNIAGISQIIAESDGSKEDIARRVHVAMSGAGQIVRPDGTVASANPRTSAPLIVPASR
jgi:hypothetical protein